MKLDRNKLVAELYEKYVFVAKKDEDFRKIALESITNDTPYEEALEIGKKNIINNIIYRMNNMLFPRLFDRTVKVMGIEKAFDFYNTIVQETGMQINTYDMIKITKRDEYTYFFENTNIEGNKFLEDVLDVYNSDTDIDLDSDKFLRLEDREYINYVKRNYELLKSREEELELINKYRQTQDDEYKDQFINSNLRLVVSLAIKEYAHRPNMKLNLLDLIQAGNIGLIEAFDKFDETKGFRFSTFATWWIKCEIKKLIYSENETIRIPEEAYINIGKMNRFKEEYMYKYGKEASKKEIMNFMDINEEKLEELENDEILINVLSYDISIQNNFEDEDDIDITNLIKQASETEYLEENDLDDETIEELINAVDFIPDEEGIDIEDTAINNFFTDQMLEYTKKVLTPNENKVILERCGFNKAKELEEYRKIAKKLKMSHQRVSQIEISAIYKLQKNSHRINNGIKVEQEYFNIKDIKSIFRQNDIQSIDIISHKLQKRISTFKCKKCNKLFNVEAKKLMETLECPYCGKYSKQLIKK